MSKNTPVTPLNEHSLLKLVSVIFLAVALLHVARLAYGWTVVIDDTELPMWISWAGLVIGAYLSYSSYLLTKKR